MPLHAPLSIKAMQIMRRDVLFLKAMLTEILQLKTLKGLALHDILTELHLLIHRGKRDHGVDMKAYTEQQTCFFSSCPGATR